MIADRLYQLCMSEHKSAVHYCVCMSDVIGRIVTSCVAVAVWYRPRRRSVAVLSVPADSQSPTAGPPLCHPPGAVLLRLCDFMWVSFDARERSICGLATVVGGRGAMVGGASKSCKTCTTVAALISILF